MPIVLSASLTLSSRLSMFGIEILTWAADRTRPWYTAPGWRLAVALLTPECTMISSTSPFSNRFW